MFDAAGFYQGPLPDSGGHTGANRHKKKTIGRNKAGGFNVSPTAAYPAGMCLFIATLIFGVWPMPVLDITAVSVDQLVLNYQEALSSHAANALLSGGAESLR